MSIVAWREGRGVDADALLDGMGPGLRSAADAPPAPAAAWNALAFGLAERLLRAVAATGELAAHEVDWLLNTVAAIGAADSFASEEDRVGLLAIEATARPLEVLTGDRPAPVHEVVKLLLRLFAWGTRRPRRDRRCAYALPDLARDAAALHGVLATRRGEDASKAIEGERRAQRESVEALLADRAPSHP